MLYLVEYPTALMGNFNPAYMLMPEQLIITPMKEHQRYFPVMKGHHLLPKFITVRNGNAEHLDVVAGRQRKWCLKPVWQMRSSSMMKI